MGLIGWIMYFLLGLLFFFIIGIINSKYSITKIQKFVITNILLMISAGICFKYAIKYTDNIFLSYVFLMVIDIIYNSYILDNDFFDKNDNNIGYYILLIIFGFFINQEFFNDVTSVFLTGNDLRLILWSFAIIFIFSFFKEKEIINDKKDSVKYKSVDSILSSYAKLKYKYYDYCNLDDKVLSNIIYSIMIYNNYKRSKILRDYDNFMFRINGKQNKLSIMQVESQLFITDFEGIGIVKKNILDMVEEFTKIKGKKKEIDYIGIIDNYCNDGNDYIKYIFEIIKKF